MTSPLKNTTTEILFPQTKTCKLLLDLENSRKNPRNPRKKWPSNTKGGKRDYCGPWAWKVGGWRGWLAFGLPKAKGGGRWPAVVACALIH